MSGGGRLVQQNGLRAEGFASGPARRSCGIPCRTGRAAHLPSARLALPGLGHAVLWRDGVLFFAQIISRCHAFSERDPFRSSIGEIIPTLAHTFSYAVRVELTWLNWRSRPRLDCQEQTAWHTLRHSLAHRGSSQLPASSACGYILPAPARKITEKKMRTLNPAKSPEQKGSCKRKTPAVIREIFSVRFYILYHGTRPERTEGPAACSDRKSFQIPLFGLSALTPPRFQACAPSPGSPAGIFAGGRRRAWKTED